MDTEGGRRYFHLRLGAQLHHVAAVQDEPGDTGHRGTNCSRRQLPRRPPPGSAGRLYLGQPAFQRLGPGRRPVAGRPAVGTRSPTATESVSRNRNTRRSDVVLFLNGLPLGIIELKTTPTRTPPSGLPGSSSRPTRRNCPPYRRTAKGNRSAGCPDWGFSSNQGLQTYSHLHSLSPGRGAIPVTNAAIGTDRDWIADIAYWL